MRLLNGLETMELGATSWRVIINSNFEKLYTTAQTDKLLKGGAELEFSAKNIDLSGILRFASASSLPATPLPAKPAGYLKINVGGAEKKIAYYDI